MAYTYTMNLESGKLLNVILMRDVQNAAELKKMIVSGELDCCAVKPALILDPFQIAVAANKAVLSHEQNRMATRKLHTEILFNLSISKNISQSLVQFGIDDQDKDLLICCVGKENMEKVLENVQGTRCSIEELKNLSNIPRIVKAYKITEAEKTVSPLLDSVVTRIAVKDFGVV